MLKCDSTEPGRIVPVTLDGVRVPAIAITMTLMSTRAKKKRGAIRLDSLQTTQFVGDNQAVAKGKPFLYHSGDNSNVEWNNGRVDILHSHSCLASKLVKMSSR